RTGHNDAPAELQCLARVPQDAHAIRGRQVLQQITDDDGVKSAETRQQGLTGIVEDALSVRLLRQGGTIGDVEVDRATLAEFREVRIASHVERSPEHVFVLEGKLRDDPRALSAS